MGDETVPSDLDSTYTKPAAENDGGWFGDSYANEGDPSWEDVIAMVVIPGSPARIKQAADEWTALLSRLGEVERVLKAIRSDLETWKGAGGEQYRNHLSTLITSIQTVCEDNSNLPHNLHLAAGDLEKAIAKIPIPDDMIAEVMAAKQGYIDHGMISDVWGPNAIYQYLLPVYGNKWFDEAREFFTWDWASNKLRDWISEQDDKAIAAYKQLAKEHVNTMARIPGSNPVEFQDPRDPGFTQPKLGGGGGGGIGGGPQAKMPGGGDPKIGGGPSLDDMADPPGSNLTDPGGGGTGFDPDDMPGSGLAGAGGGGLVGAGPGAGGLGGVGGLGPGGGGLGAGGLGGGGLGAGGLGRGAGLGGMGAGMMPGMGMGGAGAGRGGRGVTGAGGGRGGLAGSGAGRGAGAGGFRGGMMPGAAGAAGAHGEGEDHTTWLQEDDDPWGSDSEAPPSVLG